MFQTIRFLYGLVEIPEILLREFDPASLFPFWLTTLLYFDRRAAALGAGVSDAVQFTASAKKKPA